MNGPLLRRYLILLICILPLSLLQAQWLNFNDATNEWAPLPQDSEEKDIALGDLDRDGLDDIVVVRKTPFSNPGAQADLLLMNTGSNLEDQTAIYAPEFISNPSDSRDVFIGDFDNDDWLDVVIANTFEDQPIFYHNLGEDANGNWLGLADESAARFPTVLPNDPLQFCALWAGDVTGNGALDIYFSNYNPSGGSLDVLLINDGNGFFTDETQARLGDLRNSAFGTSAEIHDMDNDGDEDIVKISTLYDIFPWNSKGVYVLYNEGDGTFTNWQRYESPAPYMFTIVDFNNDGMKDVYIVDDNADYIHYTTAITANTEISYSTSEIPDQRADFFGGNVKMADLDNNGFLDIGLADVDVDIPPCESGQGSPRKFTLMRNTNGVIDAPYGLSTNPWNESTFDFAFIDLNNDGLQDIFMGRCEGYQVFLNSTVADVCPVEISGNLQICSGASTTLTADSGFSSYLWSDNSTAQSLSVSIPGTYCVTATDADGCEDATCVVVGAGENIMTTVDASICEGEFYQVGPNVYNMTGTYQTTLTASNGCDSIITLNLTVHPSVIFDLQAEICEGESLMVGDSVYTESGFYLNLLTTQLGCDSLILTELVVNPNVSSVVDAEICEGESFIIGAETFTVTGTYQTTIPAANGCDSTIMLNLNVLENSETFISASICSGESYEAGGTTFTETGDYMVTLTAANACDSIISLSLTVSDLLETMLTETICEGESYEVGMNSYTETGVYEVTLTASTGCDSMITLDLTVATEDFVFLEAAICEGDVFEFNGEELSEPGSYEVTLTNEAGCDSTVNLGLTVFEPAPILAIDALLCEGDTLEFGDMIFTEGGGYQIVLSDQNGCDSIIDLGIEILQPSFESLEATICDGESVAVGDQVFTESGDYEVVLIAENGCDSTVSLSLMVEESSSVLSDTLCADDSLLVNGTIYDVNNPSGTEVIPGGSVTGCDSTINVALAFLPAIELTGADVIEDEGTGTGSISPQISGGTPPLTFNWSNGEMTQDIDSLATGDYTLTVTDDFGCTAEFSFFVDLMVDVDAGISTEVQIIAFPNPSSGRVHFMLKNLDQSKCRFNLYDVLGRRVQQEQFTGDQWQITLPDAPGVYHYEIIQQGAIIGLGKLVKVAQ